MVAVIKEKVLENNSGLRPVGRSVLIEPYEPEFKTTLIKIPQTISDRARLVETRGIVVAIGPDAWCSDPSKHETPRAKVGDKVLMTSYCGSFVLGTKDQKTYRMVRDDDIYCQIDVE